ncbi:MAG: CobW family GTP-binding protein, partial [Acetobacteraceae bacterium]
RLIVEASGIADPAKIAEFAETDPHFTLETVAVLVDAMSFPTQRRDPRIADLVRRQLAAADVIVLNKVDLIGEGEARNLARWFSSHFPHRAVVPVRHAEVPFAALFDDDAPLRPTLRATIADVAPVTDAAFESFVFEADQPFDRARLASAIGRLPPTILRGKGLVWVTEDEICLRVFQMAGPRWSLRSAPDTLKDHSRSQLVLIGLRGGLKQGELHRLFSAALAPQQAEPVLR